MLGAAAARELSGKPARWAPHNPTRRFRGATGTDSEPVMKRRDEPLLHIARALMAAGDPAELLTQLATLVREEIEADWAAIWIFHRRKRKYSLEISPPEGPFRPLARKAGRKGGLLPSTVARKSPLLRRGEQVTETLLQHLGDPVPTNVREIFCVPFTLDSDRVGLLELIRERPTPPEAQTAQERLLSAVAAMASSASASMVRAQAGRESQMAAINRLMQLFDVSQVFHSTLEREELLPIIANRIALILEAPFCRLWLAADEGEGIVCAFPEAEGEAPRLDEGEAIPWAIFQSGESLLVSDVAEAEAAEEIDEFYGAGEAGSLLCMPMLVDESSLGVVEVIRSPGEPPFNEDDADFLEEIVRQATIALRNSNLLLAERKAHELDALLDISREITSTLDIDRVIATIVNRADTIVPSERCAILLADGNRLEVRAVSGHVEVDRKDKDIRDLEEILSWVHLSGQGVYISEVDGEIETEREETKEKFRRYFEATEMKTFVAYPLKDEEGHLGTISVESSQPYFVSEDKLEAFNILANQATVAIRNASLYRQIPLIGVMQPIVGWRSRLKKIPAWTWVRRATYAAFLTAALVFIPWNMKIGGQVVVLPEKNFLVTAEIEGVVETVHFREGDLVTQGDLLATLVDRDQRIEAEEARSRFEIAEREVAQYEARLDRVAARQARSVRDQRRDEYAILRQELSKTRITAPLDGVLLTPRLERKVGTLLDKGETFCRIADMTDIAVDILVPEVDIAEIEIGQRIRLKIDAFPTETFIAGVDLIGQAAVEQDHDRFFIVRGRLNDGGLPLRAGMVGRAKIEIGYRSFGYAFLRGPARFFWRILWKWLP
jgi:GAF domain-containing protein/biotin carboxyl carrier protein